MFPLKLTLLYQKDSNNLQMIISILLYFLLNLFQTLLFLAYSISRNFILVLVMMFFNIFVQDILQTLKKQFR